MTIAARGFSSRFSSPGWRVAFWALACLAAYLAIGSVVVQAQEAEPPQYRVFKIERSKNSKVVQYDVRLGSDGRALAADPIAAYWLREDGSTYPLSRLQWTAYGFDARCSDGCELVTLDMKANVGRLIRLRRVGGRYRAETEIAGQDAVIQRIYIKSTERRFLWPRVDYIDFAGTSIATGAPLEERFEP